MTNLSCVFKMPGCFPSEFNITKKEIHLSLSKYQDKQIDKIVVLSKKMAFDACENQHLSLFPS